MACPDRNTILRSGNKIVFSGLLSHVVLAHSELMDDMSLCVNSSKI
jgi:hypothetical protein